MLRVSVEFLILSRWRVFFRRGRADSSLPGVLLFACNLQALGPSSEFLSGANNEIILSYLSIADYNMHRTL